MTSYFRHAPVGGKQAGIQPECNQYRDSPKLLGFVFLFFCRAVICPWIHQLLLENPILLLSRCPCGGTKRHKGTDKEDKGGGGGGLLYSSVMTPPSAVSCCSAPRWSSECRFSSLLRQTYDVDGGGISLTG